MQIAINQLSSLVSFVSIQVCALARKQAREAELGTKETTLKEREHTVVAEAAELQAKQALLQAEEKRLAKAQAELAEAQTRLNVSRSLSSLFGRSIDRSID